MIGSHALCAAAGITYRQLDHWTRRGYLHAEPGPSGSGTARRYAWREVEIAAALGAASRLGWRDEHGWLRIARHVERHGLTGEIRSGPLRFDLSAVTADLTEHRGAA